MLYVMTLTPHRAIAVVLSILALSLAITIVTLALAAPPHTRAHVAHTAHITTTTTPARNVIVAVEWHAVPREVWQGLLKAGYRGVAGDGMEAIYVPARVLGTAMRKHGYTVDDIAWPLVHVVKTT